MHHDTKHKSVTVCAPFNRRAPARKRPFRWPIAAWLIGVSALSMISANAAAEECACQILTPALALKGAAATFEGRALEQAKGASPDTPRITFAVVRSWKGVVSERVDVAVQSPDAPCRPTIALGETYLVYAVGPATTLRIGDCSRTRPIAEAEEDLRVLGAGVVPVDASAKNGRPVLPETMAAPKGGGGCASCAVAHSGRRAAWPLVAMAAAGLVIAWGRRRARQSGRRMR